MGSEKPNEPQYLRPETPEALEVMVNTYRWAKLNMAQYPVGQLATRQGWQPDSRRDSSGI